MSDAAAQANQADAEKDTGAELVAVLTSRGYRGLLVVAAIIGIPVALVAYGFLALVHWLEHVVWTSVPDALGMSEPAWWYGVIVLALAGLLVGLAIKKLPGVGGHNPLEPARFGLPVLVGPGYANFGDLVEPLRAAGRLRVVAPEALPSALGEALDAAPGLRPAQLSPLPGLPEALRGALDRTEAVLKKVLPDPMGGNRP